MTKEEFHKNFKLAMETLLPFAQGFLIETFPLNIKFIVFLNRSYDKNELVGDEELFPEESSPEENRKFLDSYEQVIDLLWRNEKVPEWIDLFIHSFDEEKTYISLLCCGRFSADENLLYHKWEGYQPFHVHSPSLPPNYQEGTKFSFFWRGKKINLDDPFNV